MVYILNNLFYTFTAEDGMAVLQGKFQNWNGKVNNTGKPVLLIHNTGIPVSVFWISEQY